MSMLSEFLVQKIKQEAFRLGFAAVGICDADPLEAPGQHLETWLMNQFHGTMNWMATTGIRRADPRSYFPEAKSILVVAHNYFREDESVTMPEHLGNISIYARGRDYHKVLRKKLKKLLEYIRELVPTVRGRVGVDSFPIMEKPLAVKAGIGWIGKHTNLILKQKGSYFFLGEILLSIKLPPDEPLREDFCGTCNRCQVACPTNALDQAYVLDATRCISYLTIEHVGPVHPALQKRMQNWVFGCDICQDVCPWNRYSEQTEEKDFNSRFSEAFLNLDRLKGLSKEEFNQVFTATPVLRAGYEKFMRNVKIALQNRDARTE